MANPEHTQDSTSTTGDRGEAFTTTDGRTLFLRPIRSTDADALLRAFARLTPEQVRLRVFHPMNELSAAAVERLCNLDPATAAAWVATDADGEIRGDARFYSDAARAAEFALIVDPTLNGVGIGRVLMQKLIEESRARGLRELWGVVLTENKTMLDLAQRMGATRETIPEEPGVLRVRFDPRNQLAQEHRG